MSVPYAFGTQAGPIPLSELDANFTYLDNETTSIINNLPIKVINTIAYLRAFPVNSNLNILVNGYYTDGDGGGGYFYPVTTGGPYTDNGGTIITTGLGITASSAWLRIFDVLNVKMFGAKGDYNPNTSTGTDDSPAFNAALSYSNSINGGNVFVPPVKYGYLLNSQVWIKNGTGLVGSTTLPVHNNFAASVSQYYGGYCLVINWGAGTQGISGTTTGSAIRMGVTTTLSGFTFVYPGQVDHIVDPNYPTTNNPVIPIVFPPTISNYDYDGPSGIIENCYFVNSYIAIYLCAPRLPVRITSCWGTILKTFLILNGDYGGDLIEDLSCSGLNYLLGSPNASLTNPNNLYAWVQKNGIGVLMGHNDAVTFSGCSISDCYAAIQFGQSPTSPSDALDFQYSYGAWVGGFIEGCTFPINVQRNANSAVTITTGSPGIINWPNHGLQYGNAVQFSASTFPTGISPSTYYYVVSTTTNTFEIAATWGGAPIIISTPGTSVVCGSLTAGGINSNGFRFTNVGIATVGLFSATEAVTVVMNQPTTTYDPNAEYRGNLLIEECTFWGVGNWDPNTGPLTGLVKATGGDVYFYDCVFKSGFQNYYANSVSGTPIINFYNCNFLTNNTSLAPSVTTFVNGGSSASGRIIQVGCTFGTTPTYSIASGSTTYVTGYSPISVASASAVTLPDYGDYTQTYTITGNTNINGITALPSGRVVTLVFTAALQVSNVNNLYLNSAFVTAADSSLTLVSNGTNWYEVSRSANR